jgi:hypothetical protein
MTSDARSSRNCPGVRMTARGRPSPDLRGSMNDGARSFRLWRLLSGGTLDVQDSLLDNLMVASFRRGSGHQPSRSSTSWEPGGHRATSPGSPPPAARRPPPAAHRSTECPPDAVHVPGLQLRGRHGPLRRTHPLRVGDALEEVEQRVLDSREGRGRPGRGQDELFFSPTRRPQRCLKDLGRPRSRTGGT